MGYADGPSGSDHAKSWLDNLFGGWNGFWGDVGNNISNAVNQHEAEGQKYLENYQNNDPSYTKNREQLRRENPRVDPTANIARILGIDQQDPYPSHGYTVSDNPGRQGNDETIDTGAAGYQSEDEIRAQKIRDLMDQLQNTGPGSDMYKAADAAFQGSFDAINKARARAGENYKASDAAIKDLTAGHVHDIKTVDRNEVVKNADALSANYDQHTKAATDALAADRNAELSARAEMLSRLGIQEAGLGDAGKDQSQTISRIQSDNAANQKQADGYRAADLTRNTELASSQAAAGVERQSDLRKQLDGINANLDNSQATVENSRAQARIAGTQSDKADFLKQMEFYSNELADINKAAAEKEQTQYDRGIDARDFAAAHSGQSGAGVLDVAANKIQNMGYESAPYRQAYADVMGENGYDSRSGQDKVAYLQAAMRKKNPQLDPSVILDYIMTIENYGTDKVNAKVG